MIIFQIVLSFFVGIVSIWLIILIFGLIAWAMDNRKDVFMYFLLISVIIIIGTVVRAVFGF